jgi:hypothetical protein
MEAAEVNEGPDEHFSMARDIVADDDRILVPDHEDGLLHLQLPYPVDKAGEGIKDELLQSSISLGIDGPRILMVGQGNTVALLVQG